VIRRKRRYSSPYATWRRHGRASWWSPCLGIVWLVCTSHLCLFFIRETKCYTCVITGGREHTVSAEPGGHTFCYYIYFRQRSRYILLPVFVCLSVCLLARLLKNACMDLHEMLRADSCQDVDNWLTFQPDPHYGPDAGTALLSPISYISAATRNFITSAKNPTCTRRCSDACFQNGIIHREPSEHLRRR